MKIKKCYLSLHSTKTDPMFVRPVLVVLFESNKIEKLPVAEHFTLEEMGFTGKVTNIDVRLKSDNTTYEHKVEMVNTDANI